MEQFVIPVKKQLFAVPEVEADFSGETSALNLLHSDNAYLESVPEQLQVYAKYALHLKNNEITASKESYVTELNENFRYILSCMKEACELKDELRVTLLARVFEISDPQGNDSLEGWARNNRGQSDAISYVKSELTSKGWSPFTEYSLKSTSALYSRWMITLSCDFADQ